MFQRAVSLVFLLACSAGSGAENPPAWVATGGSDPASYPGSQYLTGYGISSPGGTPAEQRKQALAMAHTALAESIRIHIQSEFTSRVTQQDSRMSRLAQNRIRTRADVELDGLDATQVWLDPKGKAAHALAVLDKPRALLLLKEKLAGQAQACTQTFALAKAAKDLPGLLKARQLNLQIEEGLLVWRVLGGPPPTLTCPAQAEIEATLRAELGRRKDLASYVAVAALDLGSGLPQGIRVLVDRFPYADTPFCGNLSAFLEQALAAELVALGKVKILDKSAGRLAISEGGIEANLAETLHAQAVVQGTCFDLGEEVQLNLRVNAVTGEALTAATVKVPAALFRQAGLKLVPDNYEAARQALAICDAKVQASKLSVKLALDRGEGGVYRKGDKLYLFLKANMDCYVKVLYHQVDGSNVVIFPNKYHPEARIEKQRLYQIPGDDNSFDLEIGEPFGVEVVKVIASTAPIDLEEKAPDAHGFMAVKSDLQGVLGRTRGIALKKAENQYAESTMVINTMAAPKP